MIRFSHAQVFSPFSPPKVSQVTNCEGFTRLLIVKVLQLVTSVTFAIAIANIYKYEMKLKKFDNI